MCYECTIIKEVRREYLSIVLVSRVEKPQKHCAHKFFNMSNSAFHTRHPSFNFKRTAALHRHPTAIVIIISTKPFFIPVKYCFCGLSKARILNCTSAFYDSLLCISECFHHHVWARLIINLNAAMFSARAGAFKRRFAMTLVTIPFKVYIKRWWSPSESYECEFYASDFHP